MVATAEKIFPETFEEFQNWEVVDGFKYEWFDGELIKFQKMNKKQFYFFQVLVKLLIDKGLHHTGMLIAEPDVNLTKTQMRRPDIAFFTNEQYKLGREGIDIIPEFVVEVISENDNVYKLEDKITEYFKAGVKVIWNILPHHECVYVYTSRKTVYICLEDDICSASPALPDFELTVNELFKQ